MTDIPRRIRIDLQTPIEAAIRAARDAVESGPAHPHMTRATVLLGQALDAVADFVDGVPEKDAEDAAEEAKRTASLFSAIEDAVYETCLEADPRATPAGQLAYNVAGVVVEMVKERLRAATERAEKAEASEILALRNNEDLRRAITRLAPRGGAMADAIVKVRGVLPHNRECSHMTCAPTCAHAALDAALKGGA